MSFQNFAGWILLLAGLAIIIYGLYSSYNIFLGKAPAPEIFKITKESAAQGPSKGKIPSLAVDLQKEAEKMIQEQLKGMIPQEVIFNLLNLISWSIFMGILILAGGQLSSLGVKLIKK